MEYLALKSLHILGAVLLLGNIIITAWWKGMANRTGKPSIIAFAQRQVTLTDFIFTLPGAVLLVATGDYISYVMMDNSWSITWIAWGRGLFILSGILWLTVLIPVQIRMARMARAFAKGHEIPDAYWRLDRLWYRVGTLAVVLPMGNLYWMVFKPV